MENNYLSFLPEELTYTIYSFLSYNDLKNFDVNWCEVAL